MMSWLIASVFLVLILVGFTRTTLELAAAQRHVASQQAFHLAESCLGQALIHLNRSPKTCGQVVG